MTKTISADRFNAVSDDHTCDISSIVIPRSIRDGPEVRVPVIVSHPEVGLRIAIRIRADGQGLGSRVAVLVGQRPAQILAVVLVALAAIAGRSRIEELDLGQDVALRHEEFPLVGGAAHKSGAQQGGDIGTFGISVAADVDVRPQGRATGVVGGEDRATVDATSFVDKRETIGEGESIGFIDVVEREAIVGTCPFQRGRAIDATDCIAGGRELAAVKEKTIVA